MSKTKQNNEYIFSDYNASMQDECIDLFIKVFTKEPWNDVYESKDAVKKYYDELTSNNKFIGYVLKHDDKIIAVSVGFKKPWIQGMEYYIDSFYVDYDKQRSGIGAMFIEQIKQDIQGRGLQAIVLTTSRDYPSHRFYEKVGFQTLEDVVFLAFSK